MERRNLLFHKNERVCFSYGLQLAFGRHHIPYAQFTQTEKESILQFPLAADKDAGPREAWAWAQEKSRTEKCFYACSDGHLFLRDCGYVMWDRTRFQKWGLVDSEWTDWEDMVARQHQYPVPDDEE